MQGIVKKSPVSKYLLYIDIIWDLDWDVMHGVFLNVTLRILNLLFSEENKEQPFSLFSKVAIGNDLIQRFQIPHMVSRPLHKLNKFFEWKASELKYVQTVNFYVYTMLVFNSFSRDFLFIVAEPLLFQLMEQKYFNHIQRLISSVRKLYFYFNSSDLPDISTEVKDNFCLLFDIC